MAYNNYYPQMPYQPNYYANPYQPQIMQQPQQAQPAQRIVQPTIQQSGFVLVPSEREARNYPVAPGNSVTFKDENAPYCYVKTMGFNQLDRPIFEKYRLVKEEAPQEVAESSTSSFSVQENKDIAYALKSDLGAIWGEIDAIKEKINQQSDKKPAKKKIVEVEVEGNEDE